VRGRNTVNVSIKENSGWDPIAWVDQKKYAGFTVNSSSALGKRVAKMLKDGGVIAIEDPMVLTLFSIFHIGLTNSSDLGQTTKATGSTIP